MHLAGIESLFKETSSPVFLVAMKYSIKKKICLKLPFFKSLRELLKVP